MTRRMLTLVALAIAFTAFICSDPPPAAPRVHTIGLIGHRGQFYRIEDLLNPEYRAASNDPFVKSFAPPGQYAADPWAGMSPEELLGGSAQRIRDHRDEEMKSRTLSKVLNAPGTIPWAGGHGPIDD